MAYRFGSEFSKLNLKLIKLFKFSILIYKKNMSSPLNCFITPPLSKGPFSRSPLRAGTIYFPIYYHYHIICAHDRGRARKSEISTRHPRPYVHTNQSCHPGIRYTGLIRHFEPTAAINFGAANVRSPIFYACVQRILIEPSKFINAPETKSRR